MGRNKRKKNRNRNKRKTEAEATDSPKKTIKKILDSPSDEKKDPTLTRSNRHLVLFFFFDSKANNSV